MLSAPVSQVVLPVEPMKEGNLCLRLLGTTPVQSKHHLMAYHFGMHLDGGAEIVGDLDFRVGDDHDLKLYLGQIGYGVDYDYRGRGLAARSLRLLLPLARRQGMQELWITCDPDNIASRLTCERVGAQLHEVVHIPTRHALFALGFRQKCRYRLNL